jgi:hypothetical protein
VADVARHLQHRHLANVLHRPREIHVSLGQERLRLTWRSAEQRVEFLRRHRVDLSAATPLHDGTVIGHGVPPCNAVPEARIPQESPAGTAAWDGVLCEPAQFGFEKEIAKRLAWWQELKAWIEGDEQMPDETSFSYGNRSSGQSVGVIEL